MITCRTLEKVRKEETKQELELSIKDSLEEELLFPYLPFYFISSFSLCTSTHSHTLENHSSIPN